MHSGTYKAFLLTPGFWLSLVLQAEAAGVMGTTASKTPPPPPPPKQPSAAAGAGAKRKEIDATALLALLQTRGAAEPFALPWETEKYLPVTQAYRTVCKYITEGGYILYKRQPQGFVDVMHVLEVATSRLQRRLTAADFMDMARSDTRPWEQEGRADLINFLLFAAENKADVETALPWVCRYTPVPPPRVVSIYPDRMYYNGVVVAESHVLPWQTVEVDSYEDWAGDTVKVYANGTTERASPWSADIHGMARGEGITTATAEGFLVFRGTQVAARTGTGPYFVVPSLVTATPEVFADTHPFASYCILESGKARAHVRVRDDGTIDSVSDMGDFRDRKGHAGFPGILESMPLPDLEPQTVFSFAWLQKGTLAALRAVCDLTKEVVTGVDDFFSCPQQGLANVLEIDKTKTPPLLTETFLPSAGTTKRISEQRSVLRRRTALSSSVSREQEIQESSKHSVDVALVGSATAWAALCNAFPWKTVIGGKNYVVCVEDNNKRRSIIGVFPKTSDNLFCNHVSTTAGVFVRSRSYWDLQGFGAYLYTASEDGKSWRRSDDVTTLSAPGPQQSYMRVGHVLVNVEKPSLTPAAIPQAILACARAAVVQRSGTCWMAAAFNALVLNGTVRGQLLAQAAKTLTREELQSATPPLLASKRQKLLWNVWHAACRVEGTEQYAVPEGLVLQCTKQSLYGGGDADFGMDTLLRALDIQDLVVRTTDARLADLGTIAMSDGHGGGHVVAGGKCGSTFFVYDSNAQVAEVDWRDASAMNAVTQAWGYDTVVKILMYTLPSGSSPVLENITCAQVLQEADEETATTTATTTTRVLL